MANGSTSPAVNGTMAEPTRDEMKHKHYLARKLTCSVVGFTFLGVCLILLIQVVMTLASVDGWEKDVKEAMVEQETENLVKLAGDKADFVGEVFGRHEEAILQLQAFAEEVLLSTPQTMEVEENLEAYSGVLQDDPTWEHSVWFIPGVLEEEDYPERNSTMQRILNASALMDIPFRSMWQHHDNAYLAALEYPSDADVDVPSGVNMQQYPGYDLLAVGFDTFGSDDICDPRFQDMGDNYSPTTYDPRCRVWYQDAVESTTGEMVITDPYTDSDTVSLVVTPVAPVLSSTGEGILGVVGIDMDFGEIQESIEGLKVLGDEGYAYLLAPGENGVVAAHKDLGQAGIVRTIFDVEEGLDEESYREILVEMTEKCSGEKTYTKGGEEWIMSWEHERVSGLSSGGGSSESSDATCVEGYVVVVTISKAALFEVFEEVEKTIGNAVIVASLVMASVLVVILCFTGVFAYAIAGGITRPVIQLLDIVSGLNRLDFYRHEPGIWMLNDVSCPEVNQLIDAFKSMVTIVKSANLTIGRGDLDITRQIYVEALILFTKLENTRGINIVNNNLGNVYFLQARNLVQKAEEASGTTVERYISQADGKFDDAIACYQHAIGDAEMLHSEALQHQQSTRGTGDSRSPVTSEENGHDLESQADADFGDEAEDSSSVSALKIQLMNRKFNLALCLAAKGFSLLRRSRGTAGADVAKGPACISEARDLMWQCGCLAAERTDALGFTHRVEYLIEIAALERQLPGRHEKASAALQEAEEVVLAYRGDPEESTAITNACRKNEAYVSLRSPPFAVLRQRILVARAANSLAKEDIDEAVRQWDDAIVSCGYVMDARVVEKALLGIRGQVFLGQNISPSPALRAGLGMRSGIDKTGRMHASHEYLTAIDSALKRLEHISQRLLGPTPFATSTPTPAATAKVDLCFVMDCTGSMQKWIDQSKNKLLDIIDQVKEDLGDVELRVAYIGYRDLQDSKRFEGPYDFHAEEDLHKLRNNLKNIRAFGGGDVPEDIAGGLDHVTRLSWRNPIRLCILIADAPCHGSMYHTVYDNYPGGCPSGKDPAQLLCKIQYELGVDFYFIRITRFTDDMIKVFRNKLARYNDKHVRSSGSGVPRLGPPKFVERKLGEDHSRFLEVVVESVKHSAGINLRFED